MTDRQWGRGPSRRDSPLSGEQFERVTGYMRARLADDITVEQLAAVAGVSKFYFIRLFSAATGCTPHQYLLRLRLRSAAHLLSTTRHPVSEIVKMCGYASAGQFAAAFRREYGENPAAFRSSRFIQHRLINW
jgi:AraC family transcriptional regulator